MSSVWNELRVLRDKLAAIQHHFKTHECMYAFDFNILMEEAETELSEFTTKDDCSELDPDSPEVQDFKRRNES